MRPRGLGRTGRRPLRAASHPRGSSRGQSGPPILGSQRLLMKKPAVSLLAERLGACLDRVLAETRPGGGGAAGRP